MKREDIDRYQRNCARIREIADLCEQEQRERTEDETAEYETLRRDNQTLQMHAEAGEAPVQRCDYEQHVREAAASNRRVRMMLVRENEVGTTADVEGTGIIPVNEQEMLKPLRSGLIYDKVGINIKHGLTGTFRWPKHGALTAKWAGEIEAITSKKIAFDSLTAKPVRLSVIAAASSTELKQTAGTVENVIREEIPAAVVDAVNEALFTTVGTIPDPADEDKTLPKPIYGPFVNATKKNFTGATPTRKELLEMKSTVARSGVEMIAPCWVMTEAMKATLEDLKVDAGSGRFVCENDKILGYPVFTTPAIGEGNIGFGDWSYQAAGFFGSENVLVDPYSGSDSDVVKFVLHTQFATATLRPEAFILGVCHK